MATITTRGEVLEAEQTIPEEFRRFEVIDGRVVESPTMGVYPSEVATILAAYIVPHARQAGLGRVIVEAYFRLDANTQFRPDVAFISFERWPKACRTPDTEPWDMVPDLAVEVVSKNDKAVNVLTKVHRYFRAGTRAVWLVYPTLEVIHVFDAFGRIRVLTRSDVLDGGDVIPGFRLPVSSLFEETEDEGEEADEPAD